MNYFNIARDAFTISIGYLIINQYKYVLFIDGFMSDKNNAEINLKYRNYTNDKIYFIRISVFPEKVSIRNVSIETEEFVYEKIFYMDERDDVQYAIDFMKKILEEHLQKNIEQTNRTLSLLSCHIRNIKQTTDQMMISIIRYFHQLDLPFYYDGDGYCEIHFEIKHSHEKFRSLNINVLDIDMNIELCIENEKRKMKSTDFVAFIQDVYSSGEPGVLYDFLTLTV